MKDKASIHEPAIPDAATLALTVICSASDIVGPVPDAETNDGPEMPLDVSAGNPRRHDQLALARTIGGRLRQARELCDLSLIAAAQRLGYANSSKLSKIEMATDTNSVPLWLIHKAATVYEVSVDFLFGFTDDWEVGARMTQERATSAWLFDAMQQAQARDLAALRRFKDQIDVLQADMLAVLAANVEMDAGLERFIELNPDFMEAKGGNLLYGAIKRAADNAHRIGVKLRKLRMDDSSYTQIVDRWFDSPAGPASHAAVAL